jgi:hypothetical protein
MVAAVSDPTARAHAKLSASQSKRWMNCPGSVPIVGAMPAEFKRSGIHAERGTAAHTLVETCLEQRLEDCRQYEDYWINQAGDMQKAAPVSNDGESGWFIVDHDMMSAVDVMLETVYGELLRMGPQAELAIERKFDLSWLRPDMFGTSDVSISLFLTELVVIDYKHGQGVPVEVVERDPETGKLKMNSQLGYYALGVAEADGFTHETVTLIVVQPRCPHSEGPVRRYTFPMSELLELRDRLALAADRVREAEKHYDALSDEVDWIEWEAQWLSAGNHCKDSFCPKFGTCGAAFRMAQEVAMVDFADDPFPLEVPTPEADMLRLSQVLRWAPFLDGFVKAAKAHGMRAKELRMEVPDHKVVRGKANRAFVVSEEEVVARVKEAGKSAEDAYAPKKLKSPAQLEKLGKAIKDHVNGVPNKEHDPNDPTSPVWKIPPMAQKREGKLALVHISDPRPEVPNDAAFDFDDDYETESEEE